MEQLRIDKWLCFARFFKSRNLAKHLVEQGEVRCNGRIVDKASAIVAPGDRLSFPQGRARRRVLVLALAERRGPPDAARQLYEDLGFEENSFSANG